MTRAAWSASSAAAGTGTASTWTSTTASSSSSRTAGSPTAGSTSKTSTPGTSSGPRPCGSWRRANSARRHEHADYLTGWPREAPRALTGDVDLPLESWLDVMTFVLKAIRTTLSANAFDMNVSTFGSLFSRLSHHRNGLSTQPPSKLPRLPSKLPTVPPNVSTSSWVLQQSWPVSTPPAGTPALLNVYASVPTGENSSCGLPIESKYAANMSREHSRPAGPPPGRDPTPLASRASTNGCER